MTINRDGTIALARAAKEAGARRFVFASSCSMYGAAEGDAALTEAAPLRPLTPYAESKVAAEEALRELAGDDFVPVSMRNATVYGVSPRLRLDIVLNNLVAWAHTTGAIRLQSDGSSWRPLIHVRDVARATLALLEAPDEHRPRRSVQHRLRRAELPDPRARRDRPRPAAAVRGHVRGGCVSRSSELSRRLLEVRVGVPALPASVDGRERCGRAGASV